MGPCVRLGHLEVLETALADFRLIEVTLPGRAHHANIAAEVQLRVEAAFERRALDAAEFLVTAGVFASLSRRALRSREFLASRCSVSSSTICLTTRVVLSIAVSGLESYTLNRLFFISFVNFQFPLLLKVDWTTRGLSNQRQVVDLALGAS